MEENKITFEDIQKANETIKATVIKKVNKKTGEVISKDYAEVVERVRAFRMVYPTGAIIPEMIGNENGECTFRTKVFDGNGKLIAIGTAREKENDSFINQTSYIENCETSSVGRALGFAGFGIGTSIASAEEVVNATKNQKKTSKASPKQIDLINKLVDDQDALLKHYKIDVIEDLTVEQASEVISKKKGTKK